MNTQNFGTSDIGSASGGILTVRELLSNQHLAIPDYQRPYKWTTQHVNQLLGDVANHRNKSAYRLGTVVFHEEKGENNEGKKNIVDGQQRTITLMLIAHALIATRLDKIERTDLKKILSTLNGTQDEDSQNGKMVDLSFSNEESKRNIHTNYLEILRTVSRPEFDEDLIHFFLTRCELVTFTLTDISEAFQFFDSQNARGRDLKPHDLLKAFHLREFSKSDEPAKAETVATWENSDDEDLADLFAEYLFRIRNWSKRQSARYFGKADTSLFKGVNLDAGKHYPYMQSLLVAHHFVDKYNGHYSRKVDDANMSFPFALDQTIINGRRFFEMIAHYHQQGFHLDQKEQRLLPNQPALSERAQSIQTAINSYDGRHRTGDIYVRKLFDCLLMYYYDKFGTAEISRAIEKIFIWAYSLRLKMMVVQLASMDNHALENNLFALLRDAIRPEDFIHCPLPVLTNVNRNSKTTVIQNLFEDMKYYEPKPEQAAA